MLCGGVYALVRARWGDYEGCAMPGSSYSKKISSQEDAS